MSHQGEKPTQSSVSQIVMYIIVIKLALAISEVVLTWFFLATERHQKKPGGRMRQMGRGDLGLGGQMGSLEGWLPRSTW